MADKFKNPWAAKESGWFNNTWKNRTFNPWASGSIEGDKWLHNSIVEQKETTNTKFSIEINLILQKEFVPLSIPSFAGEATKGAFECTVKVGISAIDQILIEFLVNGKVNNFITTTSAEPNSIFPGTYNYEWDGFNEKGIFDSRVFNNAEIVVRVTAKNINGEIVRKEAKLKIAKQTKWVDAVIDKHNKRIDVYLRVNLKDGGSYGISCVKKDIDADPKVTNEVTICDWDKIPTDKLNEINKEPIKERKRSFNELVNLGLKGLKYYWSRNYNHSVAKFATINGIQYQVTTNPINTKSSSMDDLPLIFNTNNKWQRSGNPGSSNSFYSFFPNTLPDGIIERVAYNCGYIEIDNLWFYQNIEDEDKVFAQTLAHEIGHEILKTFGNTQYSYGHKETSTIITQETNPDRPNFPTSGEIDLMEYFKNDVSLNYLKNVAAAEKDVLGLVSLSKLKILVK
jgi:hypothetical protein